MTAALKRYRAVIRDTRFFDVIIAAHDQDEAYELADTYWRTEDLDALIADDGDIDVDSVELCESDDDRPPAVVAWSKPEVAS